MSPDAQLFNREYFMRDDVCRFCWSKNSLNPLYFNNLNTELSESDKNISEMIKDCLEIDISLTECPNKLCQLCYKKIVMFYDFKKFCQESEQRLREIINGEHLNSKIEIAIRVKEFAKDFDESKNFIENLTDSIEENDDNENAVYEYSKENKIKTRNKKRSPTYCNICCLELFNEDALRTHKSENHGIENGLYKCFGCEKIFKNLKLRLGHEINFCKGLKNGYKCAICSKYLPTRRSFEQHRRDHRKNIVKDIPQDIFKCVHCGKLFDNRDKLKVHLSEHVKKRYICETCGRVFTRQDYLHKHMHTHTGVKQYACTYCDFRANQKTALTIHIRKHTGERPYSCDMCPQKCISSSNLRVHKQKHLGVKQFECKACDKKFSYKYSLLEHMASTHVQATEHACECGATFTRPGALRRHRLAKHDKIVINK
ncbi:zinc finger protein 782-like isoform X1 [Zerene cesonia]|uniref:zinc finger protein 782-like isoform X1 n=1 Tax=Zerene cesonia TaxID=33412 RepID=UPI0018E5A16D|nr:zinc finger protein 782-like isoform X1 [Zerene cesonia]